MHDFVLLWCCRLLREYGHIEPKFTIEGCVTVLAFFVGLYFWFNVLGKASNILSDILFMQLRELSVKILKG